MLSGLPPSFSGVCIVCFWDLVGRHHRWIHADWEWRVSIPSANLHHAGDEEKWTIRIDARDQAMITRIGAQALGHSFAGEADEFLERLGLPAPGWRSWEVRLDQSGQIVCPLDLEYV